MSSAPRSVDLAQVPGVPFAWVDEHVYAAIRGCSVKVGEQGGTACTADEMRRVVQIEDRDIVREIHEWKRTFNGQVGK
jgi:hypothetical protein